MYNVVMRLVKLGVVVVACEGRICTRWLPHVLAKVTQLNQQQISDDVGVCAETVKSHGTLVNTLRTGSFKLFKRPFPGFLTILTLQTLN